MRHIPMRAGKGGGTSPREIYFEYSKIGGVATSKAFETEARITRYGARGLVFVLLTFSLALVQFPLTLPPFLPFGMEMYILYHCTLKE